MKLKTVVGTGLPQATLCIQFESSGNWRSTGSESFQGTYFTSDKGLFAFGEWPQSPYIYLSLQGSINAKRGYGTFVIGGISGYASGGGTFTMKARQGKGCS